MKSKIKVVNKFIFEHILVFLPLGIMYCLLGMWLNNLADTSRYYGESSKVVGILWIEFRTLNEPVGKTLYGLELFQVYWGMFLVTILLIVTGRLIARGIIKVITRREKV